MIETVADAECFCVMGDKTVKLTVTPEKCVDGESKAAANIMDNKLGKNFSPPVGTFGMCKSLMNPLTAAATVKNLGVLEPKDCMPVLIAPWMPGSLTVHVGGSPALSSTSILMCAYGGVITIVSPGEATFLVS